MRILKIQVVGRRVANDKSNKWTRYTQIFKW